MKGVICALCAWMGQRIEDHDCPGVALIPAPDATHRGGLAMKSCVACFRKWEQRGAPDFAEFCDDCFAKVQAGKCPAGYQHQTYLAPAGLWADWPVVVCMDGFRRGSVPFSQAHPEVRRADVVAVLAQDDKAKPNGCGAAGCEGHFREGARCIEVEPNHALHDPPEPECGFCNPQPVKAEACTCCARPLGQHAKSCPDFWPGGLRRNKDGES